MAVKLSVDAFENHNASHEHIKERVRAFQEALRTVAWDHGFRLMSEQQHANYQDWDVSLEMEFAIILGIPPKDKANQTIRLEEGRHEAL